MVMPTSVTLPALGDGIESGDVLEIFVAEGDVIAAGQDIIEMETDKATVPVPSNVAGRVVKIHVSKGQTLPIGGVILEVEAASGAPTAAPAAPSQPAQTPATPPAAAPTAPSPAASVPSAPATTELARPTFVPPSPVPAAPRPAPITAPTPLAAPVAPVARHDAVVAAGPAVRRFAREVGVDLATVQGSGDGGRITRDDVLEVVRHTSQSVQRTIAPSPTSSPHTVDGADNSAAAGAPVAHPGASAVGEPGQDNYGPVRRERMTKIRKTIAAQMHLSWTTVPRVTNFDDADITDLERLRQASKDDYAAQGLKLTTMPFLLKAVATALRHHPTLNASLDLEQEQIIYKDYVNLGVAVDTDGGLIVPVLRGVDRMSIPDVARALAEVSSKVRSGKFAVNELRGGTFTISNLGAIGGQYSTPIVNVPEVAILLVGRSRKLARVMPDDSIQPRLMMPLSLAYDHRLVDGGTAARFLNDVIGYLEAPSRLLLAL
jgi:pyruvate dehydrogenase E2 component (dihydrolipoamide acetyltransferase)